MRYWDTSAIVPLLLEQPASRRSRLLLEEDDRVVAWWATPVECWSAVSRLRRDGRLSMEDEDLAEGLLDTLRASWLEILPSEQVRQHAIRLLRVHALRAADALQLAAAIVWSGHPASGEFVTFDDRMKQAARLEGFRVLF